MAGAPVSEYMHAVGKHPPVYEVFAAWGVYLPGIFQAAAAARARLMIHITTAYGSREAITWWGPTFYGTFPNFAGLTALYDTFPRQPFMFGEYALWGSDDPGFVDAFYAWVGAHPRTRMLVYNQGITLQGPLRLWRYPRVARALRRLLASPRFPASRPRFRPQESSAPSRTATDSRFSTSSRSSCSSSVRRLRTSSS